MPEKKMPGITGHPLTTSTPDQGLFGNHTPVRNSHSSDLFRLYALGETDSPMYADDTIASGDVVEHVMLTLRQVFAVVGGPCPNKAVFDALESTLTRYALGMASGEIADVQIKFRVGEGAAVFGFHRSITDQDLHTESTQILTIRDDGELVEFRRRTTAADVSARCAAFGGGGVHVY